MLLVLFWLVGQGPLLDQMILSTLPAGRLDGLDKGQVDLVLAEIKTLAGGTAFGEPAPEIRLAADRLVGWQQTARWSMVATALCLAMLGLIISRSRITRLFRARQGVERILDGVMIVCSILAILVTVGIVLSLVGEALRFFQRIPVFDFLFGTQWDPQIAIREDQVGSSGTFGAVPVFAGTLLIATLAMLVAVPIGLFSAIYMAEYASPKFRSVVKPIMEILAGIPTIVYGLFAALTVAPACGTWER